MSFYGSKMINISNLDNFPNCIYFGQRCTSVSSLRKVESSCLVIND